VVTSDAAPPVPSRRARVARAAGWLPPLLAVLVLRAFVLAPDRVDGPSMAPTLRDGDVVLVVHAGLVARLDALDRGDLVALADPGGGGRIVKRVVGLPGDTVEIQDAVLSVDGREVVEPYVDRARIDGVFYGPVTVPPGELLVLGDNRAASVDSRDFGPVPVGSVTGRVVLRLWPWRRA
jgi:signal peptidase I